MVLAPQPCVDTSGARLSAPPLEALREALARGLQANYRDVRVRVVPCPDLRRVGCSWAGLGGSPGIVDVGGEPYAHNPRYRDVRFAVPDVLRCTGLAGTGVLGAGMACPAHIDGHCGEVIANLDVGVRDRSRVARVDEGGRCVVEPYGAGVFAGLANLYVCDGAPGPVLEVEVGHRIGAEGSLPQAMRSALAPLAATGLGPIALGGVFELVAGQIRSHVMPDYDCIDMPYYDAERDEVVGDFLRFFEPVGPDLVCFSVLWTGDPTGGALDLRPSGEHTHFYHPRDPGLGGHYHHDVTPDAVHYRGWFAPAEAVYRVGNIYARLRSMEDRVA